MRAIIYTRVSTGEQAEHGTSLESQEAECRRLAVNIGADVVAHYQDAGVSGAYYEARPGIQKALADLERDQADVLVVSRLDRSGRDVDDLRSIAERVQRAGKRLFFVDSGEVHYKGAGKAMFTMQGTFAEMEREAIHERTLKGRLSKVDKGIQTQRQSPLGYHIVTLMDVAAGKYPAGMEGKYVLLPKEAELVARIYDLYVNFDMSMKRIAREVGAEGKACGRKCWDQGAISRILHNPVYKGKAAYGRRVTTRDERRVRRGLDPVTWRFREDGDWTSFDVEPIVSEELWGTAQSRLAANKDRKRNLVHARYPLSGLMRCPRCGKNLRVCTYGEAAYIRCAKGTACWTGALQYRSFFALFLDTLREIDERPEVLEAALERFQSRRSSRLSPEAVEGLRGGFRQAEARLRAITEAEIDARIAGRDVSIYAGLLEAAALEKQRASSELAEVEKMRSALVDVRGEVSRASEEARAVLLSDAYTVEEKRDLLVHLFEWVIPGMSGKGIAVKFRHLDGFRFVFDRNGCEVDGEREEELAAAA